VHIYLFNISYRIARERDRQKENTGLRLGYTDTKQEQQ
jgi:hypothetical protein